MSEVITRGDCPFRSWVDAPAASDIAELRTVIRGWCFHIRGARIHGVRARVGEVASLARHGIHRPDVAAAFREPAGAMSGFAVAVVLPAGQCLVTLEAQLEGGTWHQFASLSLRTPRTPRTTFLQRCAVATRSLLGLRDEGREPPPAAADLSPFEYWIDHPAEGVAARRHDAVRGWCFARSGARIQGVRARVGGTLQRGVFGLARPDVEAVFGEPEAARSGFEVAVALGRGWCDVTLEVQLADGVWYGFWTKRLLGRPESFRERWRRARFWIHALAGSPAAWEGALPAEREYFLAWARGRELLNIGRWDQYAPRPLTLERFPAPRLAADRLPSLTIVTPSYNQAPFIEATLRSVLEQPGVRVDLIVQDGASSDGSADIIRRLAAEFPPGVASASARILRWCSESDGGQADAIRKGFLGGGGGPDDVMAYLNSDDVLMPGTLRFVAEYFARYPRVDAVYGHRVLIDAAGLETGRWFSPRMPCDDLRMHDLVPQETLFWRRRIWDRVGGIDPSFQFALDWDLLLRFQAAGARMVRLPWFLGLFRVHAEQKSQAWLTTVGLPEMNRLRTRTLGRLPLPEELQPSWGRAVFDSAVVQALFEHGWRV